MLNRYTDSDILRKADNDPDGLLQEVDDPTELVTRFLQIVEKKDEEYQDLATDYNHVKDELSATERALEDLDEERGALEARVDELEAEESEDA